MRFQLIDRILELDRGRRIVAVKAVTLAEEYLADHFPTFPVLPGVLMLQALVEGGSWLVREALDFAPTLILLRGVRNVTYKNFVKPGNLLRLEVICRVLGAGESEFEGAGFCEKDEVVRARFSLLQSTVHERGGLPESVDLALASRAREAFGRLMQRRNST